MAFVTAKSGRVALVLAAASILAAPGAQAKKLRIMTSVPDLADVVKRVAGERADVESLARGPEDIHQVVMKPSHVSKLNRADGLVYYGLTLEHSFVPGLLEPASNPRIKPDWTQTCSGTGCIDCSAGVEALDKPKTLSRAEGELHPMGNPHYNLGPQNDALIVKNVAEGLIRLDPSGASEYRSNAKSYQAELDAKLAQWRKLVAPLKGLKAISYHADNVYLARFAGLNVLGTVELKPGVAPTPTHLEQLVKLMKEQDVRVIIQEQHFERRTAEWLASKTEAKIAVIGVMGNWTKDSDTLITFQEKNLRALVDAAAEVAR